jgi:hypothetical protein
MDRYFSNTGPNIGPYLYHNAPAAIDVLALPGGPMPIGRARPATWVDASVALWKLTIRGAELPGLWVVVDREFRPVE